jgi:hypothetical protein
MKNTLIFVSTTDKEAKLATVLLEPTNACCSLTFVVMENARLLMAVSSVNVTMVSHLMKTVTTVLISMNVV